MKFILPVTLLIIFASCGKEEEAPAIKINPEEVKILKTLFAEWQQNEIAEHRFWAADSCYPDWFLEHEFEGTLSEMWGFPDSSELNFSYADVNVDGKLDQLVTFVPVQCDGGNGSIWIQFEVFTVSDSNNYKTEPYLGEGIFSAFGKDTSGFYWYDSIAPNKIFGRFINFLGGDGYCCPSVIRPIIIDYKTREVIYMGENIAEEE